MKQFYQLEGIPHSDYVWDIETYPNIFTMTLTHCATLDEWVFEISDRVNHWYQLSDCITKLATCQARMVGFNSIGFDYPILHHIIKTGPSITVQSIYEKAMLIITGGDNYRFVNTVWPKDRLVEQIDLFKIHHYDNKNKSVGLKILEINMGMENVEDLPIALGTFLNDEQKDILIKYNKHDNLATFLFYLKTLDMINSRVQMSERFGINMMNHNDTKIGKDYFIQQLEQVMPGSCYNRSSGKREVRQTKRDQIDLSDIVFDTIKFERMEFQRVHSWITKQVIHETKGVFKDLACTIDGFTFAFGTGGIHGSIESTVVTSDDEFIIVDWDVSSFYPNLAIVNGLHPEHLSKTFCKIYREIYNERKKYEKGTVENAAFKLALNGVYGDSNNIYSPFYDSAYTMSITINGQLLLCMLAEQLLKIPRLKMIQANTDGVTVRCPRDYYNFMNDVCKWWEAETGLQLESSIYNRMFIRDVNSYIGEYNNDGGVKRIGAYCHSDDLEWGKDHSEQVVAKAAEAALLHNINIEEFIQEHTKVTDFMMSIKVPRKSKLIRVLTNGEDDILPNVIRYVVSVDGDPIFKIMPSTGIDGAYKKANGITQKHYDDVMLKTRGVWTEEVCTKNKSRYEERRTAIQAGQLVTICNNIQQFNSANIDYSYYVDKAKKLVNPIIGKH